MDDGQVYTSMKKIDNSRIETKVEILDNVRVYILEWKSRQWSCLRYFIIVSANIHPECGPFGIRS